MSSESDRDEVFDEDMEALRRACMATGTAPEALVRGPVGTGYREEEEEEEDDDDLDLPRVIQERFSIPSSIVDSVNDLRPLKIVLPSYSDDDNDDFEILQAVQRRFEQYQLESLGKKQPEVVDIGESAGQKYQDKKSSEQTLGPEYSLTDNTAYELASTYGTSLQNLIQDSVQWHQSEDSIFKDSLTGTRDSQFPASCLMLVDALKKNRSLQKFVRSKMMHIEAKIAENKDLRERIKCLIDFQAGCKRRAGKILSQKKDPRVRLISLPKSSTKKGSVKKALYSGPVENSDVENYEMVMARFPVSLVKQPWSTSDKEKLVRGIKQQYQEIMLLEFASDPDHPISLFGDDKCDVNSKCFRAFIPLVNWERLASMYFTGRTGAECESRWLNCEDPLINNTPWTADEEKKLLFICQESGVFNWIDIASRLGTYRTPFKCLMRYQRSLNVHILKKEWTEDEDAQLCAAVEAFGDNWQLVASTLAGRTGSQCSNRWRKTVHPGKIVGRWSIDEDRRLKVAVTLFGAKNWSKIAQFVPGRNQSQCRERWVNCLDPSVNLNPWTEEEDSRLKDAMDKFGYCWSEVANYVSHRTDGQCRRRWKALFPEEVPLLQAARTMQKTALISNFVDREDERPLIGPSDFHSVATENVLTNGTQPPCRKRIKRFSDLQVQALQQNGIDGSMTDALTSVEKLADDTKTEKAKRKRKPQSKKKQGKGIPKMSDRLTFCAESVPGSSHECENGLPCTTSIEANHLQEASQTGRMDEASLHMVGSQLKLLEYTTSLKNEKRGRSRLLLKRDKSSQSRQNCEMVAPDDATTQVFTNVELDVEQDASNNGIDRSDEIARSLVVDSNSGANNVEEHVHGLSHESTGDDMRLSEFMFIAKKKKRRQKKMHGRGVKYVESRGNSNSTHDALVTIGVGFCQYISSVSSCNGDSSLGFVTLCNAVEGFPVTSGDVGRMTDTLPVHVAVMEDSVGCNNAAPSDGRPLSNGKNLNWDKFAEGGERSSDRRPLHKLKKQLRQG